MSRKGRAPTPKCSTILQGIKVLNLTKLWTFEKSQVWSVCMVTVLGAWCAMTKLPFAQKPTPAIIFWTLKIGLSCSARVRRLTGILRRAHVTIFIVDYGDFQSQLSGFSRIFEDFRGFWLGTNNIYPRCPAKNIWDFPMKIFFFKKSKIGHGGPTQNRILRRTTVTEFSKTSLIFYKWTDLTVVQVVLTGTVNKNLLLVPDLVESQIIRVVCQIVRFDFD